MDKAVVRLLEGNPILVEWLLSQQAYQAHEPAIRILRELLDMTEPTSALLYHYRSMAVAHWKDYIEGRQRVNLKKYMYCIRPVIMIQWLLHRQAQSASSSSERLPLLVIDVVEALDRLHQAKVVNDSITAAFHKLVHQKRNLTESTGECERNAELDLWIDATIRQAEGFLDATRRKGNSNNEAKSLSSSSAAPPQLDSAGSDAAGFARQVQALDRKVVTQIATTIKAHQTPKQRPLLTQLANNTIALVCMAGMQQTIVPAAESEESLRAHATAALDWAGAHSDVDRAALLDALLSTARPSGATHWAVCVPLVREWATHVRSRLESVLDDTRACEAGRQEAAQGNGPSDVGKNQLRRTFDAKFQELLRIL